MCKYTSLSVDAYTCCLLPHVVRLRSHHPSLCDRGCGGGRLKMEISILGNAVSAAMQNQKRNPPWLLDLHFLY